MKFPERRSLKDNRLQTLHNNTFESLRSLQNVYVPCVRYFLQFENTNVPRD